MKKMQSIIYILLISVILLIPLSLTDLRSGVISDIDNRKLTELPTFKMGGFTENIESYLKDRIGLRRQMINSFAVINDVVANELTHPIYTYGKDGYVFFNMHNNVEYGDYHKHFANMVLKMQQYCESRGTKFYFMLEPEKISTLRNYLPAGVNYDDSWVEEMLSYMDSLGINYVDNKALLAEKIKDEPVFNKKFNAGHWNDLGCFYATNNLFERIHSDFPNVSPLSIEDFNVSSKVEPTLLLSEFRIDETVPLFEPKNTYTDLSQKYAAEINVDPSYRHFHYYANNADNAVDLPNLLIFQGSYFNGWPQFIFNGANNSIGIHNYQNVLKLPYYYNIFKPDVVVFEAAEYVFSDNYFDSQKMKTIDWNPSLAKSGINNQYTLSANGTRANIDTNLNLIEGPEISYIYSSAPIKNAVYAYLISDDNVYDFTVDKKHNLSLSVLNTSLTDTNNTVLVICDKSGNLFYDQIDLVRAAEIDSSLAFSSGATFNDEEDAYYLNTSVPGNAFDSMVLQVIDAETGEYISKIKSFEGSYNYKGKYYHKLDSGEFILRLRANSNLEDEYIDRKVYLRHGSTYGFNIIISELSENLAVIPQYSVLDNR